MAKDLFGICPFVTSQKILQGKWAILVLHELSQGTRRFNELERGLQITHATLSSQLKSLEREGIVRRTVYPEVPPRVAAGGGSAQRGDRIVAGRSGDTRK